MRATPHDVTALALVTAGLTLAAGSVAPGPAAVQGRIASPSGQRGGGPRDGGPLPLPASHGSPPCPHLPPARPPSRGRPGPGRTPARDAIPSAEGTRSEAVRRRLLPPRPVPLPPGARLRCPGARLPAGLPSGGEAARPAGHAPHEPGAGRGAREPGPGRGAVDPGGGTGVIGKAPPVGSPAGPSPRVGPSFRPTAAGG